MNAQLIQSIIDGNPAITLSVNAADLRNIILSIVQGERIRTQAEIEKYREQPILTREQAAKKLTISKNTLNRWAANGYLIPVKIGRRVLYKPSDIDEMLQKKYMTGDNT